MAALVDPHGHDYKPLVIVGTVTGGKSDDLITVFGGDTGVIVRKLFGSRNELVKFFLRVGVFKHMVGETFSVDGAGFEYGEDLIGGYDSLDERDTSYAKRKNSDQVRRWTHAHGHILRVQAGCTY